MATDPPSGASDQAPAAANRRGEPDRRSGRERRRAVLGPPPAADTRLAERRTGMDRRRPHLHYDDLTQHPRPERNINDYPLSTDEVEFINAINDYKAKFDRPFPTWSEVLHILRTLGYIRDDPMISLPAQGGPFDPPPGAASGSAAGASPAPGAVKEAPPRKKR